MSRPRAVHTLESLKARTIEEGECWLWQGYITNNTPQVHCHIDDKKVMVSVRKLMRELITGKPQPAGSYGHTCGNPQCVNPDHTIWRSMKVHARYMNKVRDVTPVMAMKMRQAKIDTGTVKLSEEAALEIRLSTESARALAQRYGVSKSWIGRIRQNRAWRVLTSPFAGLLK